MHISPGIVTGAKLILSYGTAALSFGLAAKMLVSSIRKDQALPVLYRSIAATALVFSFFQILPHHPVGVSEVHLILGSTLFLIFGAGPAAIGLTFGLLIQGLFFAQFDLPQFGMNITTLLVPLYLMGKLANRLIRPDTAYKDVSYRQAFALSTAYQGGIVVWVGFWSLYGSGFSAENLAHIASFSGAYMLVVLVEPLVDLAVLGVAKSLGDAPRRWFTPRLFSGAEA